MIWWTTPVSWKRIIYQTEHVGTNAVIKVIVCIIDTLTEVVYRIFIQTFAIIVSIFLMSMQCKEDWRVQQFVCFFKCMAEVSVLLDCGVVMLDNWCPTFWDSVVVSSSRLDILALEDKTTAISQILRTYYSMMQCHNTAEWNLQKHSFFMFVSKLHCTDQQRRLWSHSIQKPLTTTKLYGRHTIHTQRGRKKKPFMEDWNVLQN